VLRQLPLLLRFLGEGACSSGVSWLYTWWAALTLLVLAKQQEAGSLADMPVNQQ